MGQRSIIILTILIIITVVFGVLFLVSRLLSGGGDEAPDNETEAVSTLTPAGNIVKDPVVYDNLTLEIESSITDWVTKNSFTLLAGGGGAFGGGKRQLYVVFDKNFKLPYETTTNEPGLGELVDVKVVGVERILTREELEVELGASLDDPKLELDNSSIDNWDYGILLIGEKVEVVEN